MGRRRRRRQRLPETPVNATIERLSHDGKGVCHVEGKTVFVQGGLPGETVSFVYTKKKKDFDEGQVKEVFEASADRVEPDCKHYEICGGCSLQHLQSDKQVTSKQNILLDNLQRIGKVSAEQILVPLVNRSPWGYRRKARLGVKHVFKKGKVLVGFREKNTPFIAELEQCPVLFPAVGQRLTDLAELI